MFGPNVLVMNSNAVSNIIVDLDFLESELKGIGRPHLNDAFLELRQVRFDIPVCDGRADSRRARLASLRFPISSRSI